VETRSFGIKKRNCQVKNGEKKRKIVEEGKGRKRVVKKLQYREI
jgi:hypothetical protein